MLVSCFTYVTALKIEANFSTETSDDLQRTTRHCIQEDRNSSLDVQASDPTTSSQKEGRFRVFTSKISFRISVRT
jgi:hypothetical protein